jgi:hypothetical protein
MADEEVFNVMLGEPGEDTWNTLVLGGTEVVVPVERDEFADPFQDDEVRLRSLDGGWERRICNGDDAVEKGEDASLLLYHFHDVPFGAYSVFVVSAGVEVETLHGLVVRREGVFIGENRLSETRDGQPMAPTPTGDSNDETSADLTEPPDEASADDEAEYIDQDDEDA